ncbi:acyltransferase family protein [Tenacibaculum singaporense]|uniref:acyltransferase family protein n=1 Tax=Tenacibaculum singaporense TaxID=2358479 RepID=UPI000F67348F|nr:acyltransferase [Tenacibaculum singaporense]RSC92940.1 acyltransferase [Tenacibaculum singaporense]
MYKQIKYFKGLNGLRFFAAFLVLLHHAEQIRLKNEIFNLKELSLFNNGGLAVTFFFVLSGFLISYLLLKEQNETKHISIKRFYVRRILRIWPLYFLLVVIGTLIIPLFLNIINYSYEMPYTFNEVILYYIFFSPFMVNILFGHHLLEPLWSIGVEELFYIIWAPLFKFLKKHILTIILSVIVIKIILLIASNIFQFPYILSKIIRILKFESMAIGGLAAYLIYHRKKKVENSILFSRAIQVILILFLVGKLFVSKFLVDNLFIFDYIYNSDIFSHLTLSCSFAWLVVNVSLNSNSLINLDSRVLNFLGEISYGIYMYHMLIIFGIILFFKNHLATMSRVTSSILFYFVLTIGVILVSFISKKIFEDYFLRLKDRFRISQHTTKDMK